MIKKITLLTLTFFCLGMHGLLAQCPNTFVTSFTPSTGPVNTTVTINGSGFQFGTGVSMVYFDGNEASYTIVSDTQITAVVPEVATQGLVAVVGNGGCMASSAATFTPMESMCSAACEIYISEVYDKNGGNPGAIELYNPCPTTIVFGGQYILYRSTNVNGAADAGYTTVLPGSIAGNSTILLRTGDAYCPGLSFVGTFGNGINDNDDIWLTKNSQVIDRVHTPSNIGYTLIRKPAAIAPQPAYNSNDWNINLNEDCANLGQHYTTVTPPTAEVPTVINPDPVEICQYDYAVFSAGVSGSGWTYQWKTLNSSGQWVNVVNGGNFSGANTDTFVISNTPLSLSGTQYYCQITSTSCNLITYAALLTVNAPQPPTVIVTQPNCNTPTGSILVTSPVTPAGITYSVNGTDYQTSPSFPNLPAGTYPVTVQDLAGCISAPFNVTLSAPILTPVFTVTQPTCTNPYGTIVITSPTGPGITYSYNGVDYVPGTTLSPLAPGTYPITAKSPEGCVSTIVNQVINPIPTPPAQPTATITQPGCGTNGQIVVTAPTGNGLQYSIDGTTYQSSPTFNAVGAGSYQVTVKNGDCVSAPLSVTLTNGSVPSCIQNPGIDNVTPASTDPYLAAKGSWFTSHGSPAPSASSVWMFSYSGQTQGEGMYTCYNFEQGKTYKVCVNVDSDNLPGSLGYTNPDAQVYIEATNGTFTPRPAPAANQVIANWHMINADPQDFTYTFTASANFNKLWIFPYMQASASNANDQYMINVYSVKVEELPAATPAASLAGNTVTVTNTPPNGHWEWAPAGITTSQNAQNSVVTVSGNCSAVALVGTFVSNCQICSEYTVNVNLPAAPLEAPEVSVAQPDCTSPEGIVEITSPLGTQYTYSADNGDTWQPEPIFDLAPGTYEILVQIAAQNCQSEATTVVINAPTGGPAAPTVTTVQPTCTAPTGTITVTAPSGTGYMYSKDGGDTFQAGTAFTVTPGTYEIVVQDGGGCISAPTEVVINPAPAAPAVATTTLTQPDCDTATGTITITNPTGTGITYSIDNGDTWVTTTVFTVNPGTYTIITKNAAGCTSQTGNIVINPQPATPAIATTTAVQPDCDSATGTITVTNPTGTGITYSIDNGDTWVSTTVFTVDPGTYTILTQNAAGCISQTNDIVINPAPAAPAVATTTLVQPDCDTATGTITITAPVGNGVTYSIDNGDTWVTTTVFTVDPGTYTILTQNAAGCIAETGNIVINPVPNAPAVATTTVVQPDCDSATGTITITNPVGTGFTYSIDNGGTWVSATTFTVDPGTYTIMTQNAAGCTSETAAIVINPSDAPAIAATTQTQPDCNSATGTITVTAPVGAGYSYSIDNGDTWITTTVFTVGPGTYTVITMNAAGCTSQTNDIEINPQPAIPAVAGTTLVQPDCDTATGTITITAPVGTGITYSIDEGDTWVATTVFTVDPGTYTIMVQNANGCTSETGNLVINPQPATPEVATTTVTQPDCTTATGTITISAPVGPTITYSADGGDNWQASPVFTLSPGTYSIITQNAAGCTSETGGITINPQPASPAVASTTLGQPDCDTGTGTITITAPTGAGITYSIDNGNTWVTTTVFTVDPGTYTIRTQNANGCTSQTASLVINPQPATPVAPTVTATQPGCTTQGTITISAPLGAGYTYSIDNITYVAATTFTVAPGTYPVTAKNAAGCISPVTTQVINAAPPVPATPSVTAIQPTCTVNTGTITITAPTGPGITYSTDGINYVTTNTFTLAPGTYPVTVKNASGCVSPINMQTINPVPQLPATPAFTVTQPGCGQTLGSIVVTSPTGTGMQYSKDGGTTWQNSPTFGNLPAATYTIVVKNASGCLSSPVQQTINPAPTVPAAPVLAATQPDCNTATGTITVTVPLAGATYSINNGPFGTATSFSTLPQGTYTITVKNSDGCTAWAQLSINAAPAHPPVPTVSPIQPDCNTATGRITVTAPLGGGHTYSLDGVLFQASPTFPVVNPGTYTLTVKNNTGCTSTLANIVIDAPPAPAPSPGVITGPGTVCIDGTLQLANTVTGGTWASTNTNIATVDPTGLVTPVNAGTVTITYTVGTICTDFAQRTITIVPLPQPHPADMYYLCVDNETGEMSPVTIYTGLTQTDNTFAWTKDGDPLPFTTTSIVVNEPGDYEVTVTNTASGCSNTATTTVGTSSLAVAYAEVGEDFHANQMITIHVTGGTGDYEYSLDGGPYQDENYFTGIISGEYHITVRDKNGCGVLELEVFALNYPHYFTPNDDGNQDFWNINGLSSQYNARIYVFDRYGKLITFIRPSGSRGWDGTLNGHRLPATDYWFTVEYRSSNGEDKEYKAHFSLIR